MSRSRYVLSSNVRENPASQHQSNLCCWKMFTNIFVFKQLPPPNLVKKQEVHSFHNCINTWCHKNGFVVSRLLVSTNGILILFLGVVNFKRSTLAVYSLSSCLICTKNLKLKNHKKWWIGGLSRLSWFQVFKYILPSFWPAVKRNILKKVMP